MLGQLIGKKIAPSDFVAHYDNFMADERPWNFSSAKADILDDFHLSAALYVEDPVERLTEASYIDATELIELAKKALRDLDALEATHS